MRLFGPVGHVDEAVREIEMLCGRRNCCAGGTSGLNGPIGDRPGDCRRRTHIRLKANVIALAKEIVPKMR